MRLKFTLHLLLLLAGPCVMAADSDHFINAKVTAHRSGTQLDRTVYQLAAQAGPGAWIVYEVATLQRSYTGISKDPVILDSDGFRNHSFYGGSDETIGSHSQLVLLRINQRTISRIEFIPTGLLIDGQGQTIHWLGNVTTGSSIDLLTQLLVDEDLHNAHLKEGVITVLAFHDSTKVDQVLEALMINESHPNKIRKQAAFCLGTLRGKAGFNALAQFIDNGNNEKMMAHAVFAISQNEDARVSPKLNDLLRTSPYAQVREQALFWLVQTNGEGAQEAVQWGLEQAGTKKEREHAVFLLAQMKTDESLSQLIELAKTGETKDLRAQALFWLAQEAGERSAPVLEEILEGDESMELKEQAVFSLAQQDPDVAIPNLIELATNHPQPQVRKQAMFWLGQTGDPRALAFMEKILVQKD